MKANAIHPSKNATLDQYIAPKSTTFNTSDANHSPLVDITDEIHTLNNAIPNLITERHSEASLPAPQHGESVISLTLQQPAKAHMKDNPFPSH